MFFRNIKAHFVYSQKPNTAQSSPSSRLFSMEHNVFVCVLVFQIFQIVI